MLGAASVLVVHARSWILLAEESTHRTTGEQGAVALNPESGQTATTLESPNKTPPSTAEATAGRALTIIEDSQRVKQRCSSVLAVIVAIRSINRDGFLS